MISRKAAILAITATSFLIAAGTASSAVSISVPSKGITTIANALAKAQSGDTVWVDKGIYQGNVFVGPGIALLSRTLHGAAIDGGGRGVAVSLASGCTVSGFEIRNGTIGIFSSSADNHITRCRVINNSQSGIMCVGHVPAIEDNIIAFNKGSGVQGWDARTTMAIINHNTIAYNANHGLAFGGNSAVILENNIIAYNGQFAVKTDLGTIKVSMTKNDIFGNSTPSGTLPIDNLAADPGFTDAQKLNFSIDRKSPCAGGGTDQKDIGTRTPGE